jgi:hypothetical protein
MLPFRPTGPHNTIKWGIAQPGQPVAHGGAHCGWRPHGFVRNVAALCRERHSPAPFVDKIVLGRYLLGATYASTRSHEEEHRARQSGSVERFVILRPTGCETMYRDRTWRHHAPGRPVHSVIPPARRLTPQQGSPLVRLCSIAFSGGDSLDDDTLCVRRATFWDPEMNLPDDPPRRRGSAPASSLRRGGSARGADDRPRRYWRANAC